MVQTLNTGSVLSEGGLISAPAKSAASWPGIFAGAFVAVAISIVLLALGSGFGFASVSPWADHGVTATTFAVTTAIWLLVTQWVSSGIGGYIAGRLRTKWVGTHTHEVFFRDTAHGLVTWAVATVVVAALAASSVFTAVGGGARAAADAVGMGAAGLGAPGASMHGGPRGMGPANASDYGLDKLFRSEGAARGARDENGMRAEALHIVGSAATTGTVTDEDRAYLASLVAGRAGISQADAQKRVDDFIAAANAAEAKAKAAADSARKAAAEASIYLALSLLIGAFIASVAAALGGRQRDEHV
jgi:hypothetical protein